MLEEVLLDEAEMIPFPSEDATPPVTKMYFVVSDMPYLERLMNTGRKDIAESLSNSHFFAKVFKKVKLGQNQQ